MVVWFWAQSYENKTSDFVKLKSVSTWRERLWRDRNNCTWRRLPFKCVYLLLVFVALHHWTCLIWICSEMTERNIKSKAHKSSSLVGALHVNTSPAHWTEPFPLKAWRLKKHHLLSPAWKQLSMWLLIIFCVDLSALMTRKHQHRVTFTSFNALLKSLIKPNKEEKQPVGDIWHQWMMKTEMTVNCCHSWRSCVHHFASFCHFLWLYSQCGALRE